MPKTLKDRKRRSGMLIQLVSGLPPDINGVGDYAHGIARVLRDAHNIDSMFVVCNPNWSAPAEFNGFRAVALRERSASALVAVLQEIRPASNGRTVNSGAPTLLLQLSPYGFDTNGAPFWLSRALGHWKAANNNYRIITTFHELYAAGPPWTRAFWVSALQRAAVRQIAVKSDVAITNMERYATILRRWDPSKAGMITVLPVPSNVGEVPKNIPLAARTRRLVIFGSKNARATIFREHSNEIQSLCSQLDLREITEIGANGNCHSSEYCGVRHQRLGVLPAHEISRILEDSVVGLVHYPTAFLGKSGIFAAYCAHGMLPVRLGSFQHSEESLDGIEAGRNFASSREIHSGLNWSDAVRIAACAWLWYGGHSIKHHAEEYCKHLYSGSVISGPSE